MNLKTSFFNKTIIKSDFKRLWWIPALHTILLFLTGTMVMIRNHYIMKYPNSIIEAQFPYSNIRWNLESYYIFALIVPVVLGVMLFSYMQTGKASTFAHCLPVSRGIQYLSHIISGVVMFSVPLLINSLILLLLRFDSDFARLFQLSHLFYLMWEVFLYSILAFSGACCVSFIAGNTVASLIFTYIFAMLPALAEVFVSYFAETQLFGYVVNYDYSLAEFLYVSPGMLIEFKNTLLYVILTVALFGVGFGLYKLRHLENHSEVVALPKLRPVFIYGVGICCGCAGFAYFNGIWNATNPLLLIPLGVLGIVIAQMIVKKSFKVPEVYKPVLGYSVFVLLVFIVFNFDLTGYERRIPAAEDIEYVTFSQEYINNDNRVYYTSENSEYYLRNRFSPDIKDKAAIEDVRSFHKYLVLNKDAKFNKYETVFLNYKLKNGKTLNRKYLVNLTAHKEKLESIIESDIIRQQYFPILREDNRKINSVSIYDNRLAEVFKTVYPSDEDLDRLTAALKKDLSAADYDEFAYRNGTFTYLNISFTRPGYYIDGRKVEENNLYVENETYYIRSSYVNTISILEEMGLYDLLPTAEDVEKVYVNYFETNPDSYRYVDDIYCNKVITDKNDIEEVFSYITENQTAKYSDGSVTIVLKNSLHISGDIDFDDESLPQCLRP